jgi:hypothetical protein
MTRNEQEQFVVDMLFAVAKDIVVKFDSGAIPEHWDGVQLRQYITDKVKERCDAGRFMTPKDYSDYLNTVYHMNNNL